MTRSLLFLLSAHLFFLSSMLYVDKLLFALNFEIGFFGAGFIILMSFRGYKKMIDHSVDQDMILSIDDPLKAIEDPYDLYDEDETNEDLTLKDDKKRVKKEGLKKMVKSSAGHFSFGRVGAYLIFIIGFLSLRNSNALVISGLLIGLTLGIIITTLLVKHHLDHKSDI